MAPEGLLRVKFDFANSRTGTAGRAEVQTMDPDAVSADPRARAAFLRRITAGQALDLGCDVNDLEVTVDADSVAEARAAAARETDAAGLTFFGRIAAKVQGRFSADKLLFDHATAVVVLLRRSTGAGSGTADDPTAEPTADPTNTTADPSASSAKAEAKASSVEAEAAAQCVLTSSTLAHLVAGNWVVGGAMARLFALQKADPRRRAFSAQDDLCTADEDPNTRALVELWLDSIAALSQSGGSSGSSGSSGGGGVDAEEALLAATVRSGRRLDDYSRSAGGDEQQQ